VGENLESQQGALALIERIFERKAFPWVLQSQPEEQK